MMKIEKNGARYLLVRVEDGEVLGVFRVKAVAEMAREYLTTRPTA